MVAAVVPGTVCAESVQTISERSKRVRRPKGRRRAKQSRGPRVLTRADETRIFRSTPSPYWYDEQRKAEQQRTSVWPPPNTSTPPLPCLSRTEPDDPHRLYPAYYVSRHDGECVCADCNNERILRGDIRRAREWGYLSQDGLAGATIQDAEDDGFEPTTDSSPSGQAVRAMGERGVELVDAELAPEDEESLRRQIALKFVEDEDDPRPLREQLAAYERIAGGALTPLEI